MWVRVAASSTPVDCTVASHVTSTAADATDDVRCEVALLWTVVLAVTDATTILAYLVLVITKGTIQRSELA